MMTRTCFSHWYAMNSAVVSAMRGVMMRSILSTHKHTSASYVQQHNCTISSLVISSILRSTRTHWLHQWILTEHPTYHSCYQYTHSVLIFSIYYKPMHHLFLKALKAVSLNRYQLVPSNIRLAYLQV